MKSIHLDRSRRHQDDESIQTAVLQGGVFQSNPDANLSNEAADDDE